MILIWSILVILGVIDLVNTPLVVFFDICLVIIIIYQVLLLSLLNRTVTGFIVQSFEFWFKMIYATRLCVCSAIRMICQPLSSIFVVTHVMNYIMVILGILVFCFLDGLSVPLRVKTTFLVLLSAAACMVAASMTFSDHESCVMHLFGSIELDVVDSEAGTWRILAIFICKQTFYSIFKQPKSSLIYKSVKILWI